MFNSDPHHHHQQQDFYAASFSPRISFSGDFLDAGNFIEHDSNTAVSPSRRPATDSGFAFSVSNESMMTADQLFHQGRLLPFKGESRKKATLRDELSVADEEAASTGSVKGSKKWKKLLGFRHSHARKPIPHLERVQEKYPFQPNIDARDEAKIWGRREEQSDSSSSLYGWYVRDEREIEECEDGEQQED